jgi:hypothetical protein
MFTLIPLDVWVAAVLAAAAGLMAIFGPSAGVFILIYVFFARISSSKSSATKSPDDVHDRAKTFQL